MQEQTVIAAVGSVVAIVGVAATVAVCVRGATVTWRVCVAILAVGVAVCGGFASAAAGRVAQDIGDARDGPDDLAVAVIQAAKDNSCTGKIDTKLAEEIASAARDYDVAQDIDAEYSGVATVVVLVLLTVVPATIAAGLQISGNRLCYAAAAPLLVWVAAIMLALAVGAHYACTQLLDKSDLPSELRWVFFKDAPGTAPYLTPQEAEILSTCSSPDIVKWTTAGPLAAEYSDLVDSACTDARHAAMVGAALAAFAAVSGLSSVCCAAGYQYKLLGALLLG
ncbi:MAG: hypothetical protein ACPGR8_12395 [Limisphaerales bacterium]